MNRRAFISLIGAAVPSLAWPAVARAQQGAMPVIGFLGAPAAAPYARYVDAVHQGLREAGYVEGRNVAFEYRWADGQYDRLPALAADLIARQVAVIVPIGGVPPTVAAKAATSTIPIVFNMAADPVELGLVASLNRPGGNITGVAMLAVKLETKRIELLHEFVPASALLAVLVNPRNPQVELQLQDVQTAARTIGQRILVLNASSEREIEAGFAALAREQAAALLVCADTYFASQPSLFAALTARHAVPAIYPWRSHADAGGLMSYGTSLLDAYRQAGIYAGRVLKGEKPGELPVMQAAKFEFVVNLKAAKALGLDLPATLLAIADEVIE